MASRRPGSNSGSDERGEQPGRVLALSPKGTLLLAGSSSAGWVGIRSILYDAWHWRIVGDSATVEEAELLAARRHPDIILLAVQGRAMAAQAVVDRLHGASPQSKILLLTETVEEWALLCHPAVAGYLLWNNVAAASVEAALVAVEAGWWAGSPESVLRAARNGGHRQPDMAARPVLTDREHVVLRGRIAGKREKVIAAEENVGVRTVEAIVQSLKGKFHAHSTGDLCARARDLGFGE